MKKLAVGLSALAAALAFAPVVSAGSQQGVATEIIIADTYQVADRSYHAGVIKSVKPKCRANRQIRLEIRNEGESRFHAYDSDRSSRRGAWALQVPGKLSVDADHRYRAPRQKVGRNTVCAQDVSPLL